MTEPISDERLCWLAVRDQVERHANRLTPGRLIAALVTFGQARDGHREKASDEMHEYAFAVDDAARLLKPDERRHLRQTGQVPDWFLPEVQRRATAQSR